MLGYNNATEPEPPSSRRTPKRYTKHEEFLCAQISDVSHAHQHTIPPFLHASILLSRGATPPFWFLFSRFSPTLACFFLCFSPPLLPLAHLPFQLPAGMHVTSPILSRQNGMRQSIRQCFNTQHTSTSSPFLLHIPPLPPFLLPRLLLIPCRCLFLTSKHIHPLLRIRHSGCSKCTSLLLPSYRTPISKMVPPTHLNNPPMSLTSRRLTCHSCFPRSPASYKCSLAKFEIPQPLTYI
ncbi:hypothetical protein HDV64DRAFT_208389 [Trichoderma sp. TUCIM 5745]